jgi:phosphoserine phosphatase
VARWLLATLGGLGLEVVDLEQVQVHGRLLLCCEVGGPGGPEPEEALRRAIEAARHHGGPATGGGLEGIEVAVTSFVPSELQTGPAHEAAQLVTVLAPALDAPTLAEVCGAVTDSGGNIARIGRLATYPVVSYELEVDGAEPEGLRRRLGAVAARRSVDVAVQRAGLHRRAKHLIVLDADSTLIRHEVIDLLAQRAGRHEEVAAITAAAMAGGLDFRESLARRLSLVAGLPEEALEAVAGELVLTPGARTLVRTLRRLGYVTAVVSGGFTQVLEPLTADLGIDFLAANTLEVRDGRLTGEIVGPVVDRAGKAAALARFARLAGVPMSRTIAVGDGANDVDMLAAAGLGIAFNAKPVVRGAADASINVPYLDAILFLLGMSRREIEAADLADGPGPAPATHNAPGRRGGR